MKCSVVFSKLRSLMTGRVGGPYGLFWYKHEVAASCADGRPSRKARLSKSNKRVELLEFLERVQSPIPIISLELVVSLAASLGRKPQHQDCDCFSSRWFFRLWDRRGERGKRYVSCRRWESPF